MRRPLRLTDLVAWIVAGFALALTVAAQGLVATAAWIVFCAVETTIVLEFLGMTPEDLR
jgi:hypothetical protein